MPEELDDSLLYGQDDEERIVAIEPLKDRHLNRIYTRHEDDTVTSRVEKGELFVLLNENNPVLDNIFDNTTDHYPLFGDNHYNTVLTTENISLAYKLKNQTDAQLPMMNCQYQIQTGKTLFMGMEFDDQLAMAFDSETITTDGYEFPNPKREGDEITIITCHTNRGNSYVISQDEMSEAEVLREFIKTVHQVDPDVLVGHYCFNFDLPYIEERCKRYGIEFALGRDGSEPYTFETKMKFAEKDYEYTNYCFNGRHVIDTDLLARQADVVKRQYSNYQLKYLAQETGVTPDDRTYVEGSAISDAWKNKHDKWDREDLLNYALDDVIETMGLYEHFGQAIFYSTQFLPMSYQDSFRLGSGVKVEYTFMRRYLEQGYSWPKPEQARSITGGYAFVNEFGYTDEHVVYADVASLYPSLGEKLEIQPSRDILGYYQKLLKVLKAKRYEFKDEIKNVETEKEKDQAKSKDGSVKIILNSMSYGYLSWSGASFNDYDEAERITTAGRRVLKDMNAITELWGGRAIKGDTDGALMTIPPMFDSADEYCEELSAQFDEYIEIDNDGEYEGIIIFDKKSYAMLNDDGSITKKGNTITGRGVEPFGREMISECIDAIIEGDKWNCTPIFRFYEMMIEGRFTPPEMIGVRGNIKDSLDEYKHKVALGSGNGGRNRASTYELALQADKDYSVGDVISYYIKEPPKAWLHFYGKKSYRKPKLSNYEKAEFLKNYDFDYDMEYYRGRLETHMKRFLTVFTPEEFDEVFNISLDSKDKKRLESYGLYTN